MRFPHNHPTPQRPPPLIERGRAKNNCRRSIYFKLWLASFINVSLMQFKTICYTCSLFAHALPHSWCSPELGMIVCRRHPITDPFPFSNNGRGFIVSYDDLCCCTNRVFSPTWDDQHTPANAYSIQVLLSLAIRQNENDNNDGIANKWNCSLHAEHARSPTRPCPFHIRLWLDSVERECGKSELLWKCHPFDMFVCCYLRLESRV